jgi:hypothetical protein
MSVNRKMFRIAIWFSCWAEIATGLVGVLTFGYCCPEWEMDVVVWAQKFNRDDA